MKQPIQQLTVTVAGIKVRQDSDGRFSLNDLHKAAVAEGANKRTKEPGKFLATNSFAELVVELTTQNPGSLPVVTVEGRKGGTYVCKELVYAYAMWISARFHLQVIRAYDALVTGQLALAEGRASRQQARLEAPFLTDAVKHSRQALGKPVSHYHFSNEFDLINRIALNRTSKQYRIAHGLAANDPIRDYLTPCEIQCIEHLQRVNASLIDIGMPYQERKARLHQIYCQRHAAQLCREVAALEA